MPLLIMFLIWYGFWGQNNPKSYHRLQGKLSKIIGILILLSIFSSIIPNVLWISLVLLIMGGIIFGPFIFLGWLIKLFTGGNKRQQKNDYEEYQKYYEATRGKKKKTSAFTVTGLTKSVSKRTKIVQKFNKKYQLNLTDAEIERIVDASYYSNCWEREIYDMSESYDTLHQWYNADTNWLRAYLHAFPVQSVISDFEAQREICLQAYTEIFENIQPRKYASIDDCVDSINDTFFTNFDENTFMIAYRFLERNGKKYELPHMKLMRAGSDLDALREKYDNSSIDYLQQKYDQETTTGRERRRL